MPSTFRQLIEALTRDVERVQPKDALQFCANWFQSRLEEQRTRTRDTLTRRSSMGLNDLPTDHYLDSIGEGLPSVSPFTTSHRHSFPHHPRTHTPSAPSPFGTLNVPGNALLSGTHAPPPPMFKLDPTELSPTANGFLSSPFDAGPHGSSPGDYLHPPSATILARRTSVSAESIAVDGESNEPLPVYPKTDAQLKRIRTSIFNNFIFRDLDEEQESGVLAAMEEISVPAGEVVIRQGDVGEFFYVVEQGLLYCYIKADPPPPPSVTAHAKPDKANSSSTANEKFVQPVYHPEFGRKVADCLPGTSFGELALMYGHPRAATVLAIEPCMLWRVDRITFRTIILKAAHRRRTMYEHFLSTVPLLSSLEPEERSKIADALASRVYLDGEDVVRQGEMGDTFFFVEEGEAVVTKKQEGGGQMEINRLRKGEYFGGSLLSSHPTDWILLAYLVPFRTLFIAPFSSCGHSQCCSEDRSIFAEAEGSGLRRSSIYASPWASQGDHGTQGW